MSFKFCHFKTILKIWLGHCGPLTPFLQFRHLLLQSRQVCWVTFSHWFLKISFDICKFAFLFINYNSWAKLQHRVSADRRSSSVQPEAEAARARERRAQLVCLTGCLVAVNLPAVSVMLWIGVSFQKMRFSETSERMSVLLLKIWEKTRSSLMWPWLVRMVSRWRLTRWFSLPQVPSFSTSWRGTNIATPWSTWGLSLKT